MPSEIISEQRATSNRNGARDHPGIPGDFSRNPHAGVELAAIDAQRAAEAAADLECRLDDGVGGERRRQNRKGLSWRSLLAGHIALWNGPLLDSINRLARDAVEDEAWTAQPYRSEADFFFFFLSLRAA